MIALAPEVPFRAAVRRLRETTPAQGESRGTVALLQGCVQRVFFGDVNEATLAVLSAEGYEVHAPRAPRCCGSLMMHSGYEDEARVLAKQTIDAFEGHERVVVNAAGCGSGMKEYRHLLDDEPEWAQRAADFSDKVIDVHELLAEHEPRAPRRPLEMKVVYHDACHLAHAQGVRSQPRELLRAIPEPRAARARRGRDLLRLGRDLQPAQARGRRGAGPPQGGPPPRHGGRGDRRRQPRLLAADRGLRARGRGAAPGLPPDGAARHVDRRETTRCQRPRLRGWRSGRRSASASTRS
ncbi:MAG: (Fe-S)-binding protein [Thermoleophilaceae bacterium]